MPEFEQVVGQADELPFGLHLVEAPHGELAETAGWFDLTEHWFDWSFLFLVRLTPLFGSQRTGHPLLRGERLRDAIAWHGRELFVVLQTPGTRQSLSNVNNAQPLGHARSYLTDFAGGAAAAAFGLGISPAC